MSTIPAIRAARLDESAQPMLLARLAAVPRRFALCASRWRQRRDLADLDDYLLRDIGVTREQARREAGRPFWQ